MEPLGSQVIVCSDCGGRGRLYDGLECVATLGIALLFGRDKCERCAGTGYLKLEWDKLKPVARDKNNHEY